MCTDWHKLNKNFKNAESREDKLNLLYQEGKIYVMDNHLAAGWCWYHTLKKDEEYNFCHIDQHDDLANGNHEYVRELFSKNKCVSLENYIDLHHKQSPKIVLPPIKVIRWDNYILHFKGIHPEWFNKETYACHEFISGARCSLTGKQPMEDYFELGSDMTQIPIHPDNIKCYDLHHSLAEKLNDNEDRLWIVNFDIDYFFHDKCQLFSNEYIDAVCDQINQAMDKIAVLTIALSPECCYGWDNSIRVYNQIAKRLSIKMKLE